MTETTYKLLQLFVALGGFVLSVVGAYFGARLAVYEILFEILDNEGGENDVEDSGQSG